MSRNRNEVVALVAGQAHEDWRSDWRSEHEDQPRVKKTSDPAFNARGVTEVNIAALAYADLPSDWQAENRLNAEVAYGLVEAAGDDFDLEKAAAKVHDAWLGRNQWAKDDPKLGVPYAELPEQEKEKDRLVLRRVLAALEG